MLYINEDKLISSAYNNMDESQMWYWAKEAEQEHTLWDSIGVKFTNCKTKPKFGDAYLVMDDQ